MPRQGFFLGPSCVWAPASSSRIGFRFFHFRLDHSPLFVSFIILWCRELKHDRPRRFTKPATPHRLVSSTPPVFLPTLYRVNTSVPGVAPPQPQSTLSRFRTIQAFSNTPKGILCVKAFRNIFFDCLPFDWAINGLRSASSNLLQRSPHAFLRQTDPRSYLFLIVEVEPNNWTGAI